MLVASFILLFFPRERWMVQTNAFGQILPDHFINPYHKVGGRNSGGLLHI
jgi:hypothetical protein